MLLVGMLATSPLMASELLSTSTENSIHKVMSSGDLFLSPILMAKTRDGFSKPVRVAVKIIKNANDERTLGKYGCTNNEEPDTVLILIQDAKTNKVLDVVARVYGNIESGENELKKPATSVCMNSGKKLNLSQDKKSLKLQSTYNSSLLLGFGTNSRASVSVPMNMVFKK